MARYLRLYVQFLAFSFKRSLEYRMDFWFRVAMDCVYYAVQIGFFSILYLHTQTLGGWTYDQVLVFVAGYLLSDAIHMTIFSNNMWWLPILVNRGDLDYYLVRPVSSLFFLSLRDFAANSFLNLLIAIGLLVWALLRFPLGLSLLNLSWFLFLLLCGNILRYSLHMFFVVPVFWMHTNRGLANAYYSAVKLIERPDQIFSFWVRRLLMTVFPVLLIVSVPVGVLFEGPKVDSVVLVLSVTGLLFFLLQGFWALGLRAYSSASS